MSVTRVKWVDRKGTHHESWKVFVRLRSPDGVQQFYRKADQNWTRSDALAKEAEVRDSITKGTYKLPNTVGLPSPTVAEFAPKTTTYASGRKAKKPHLKASAVFCKERVVEMYIIPFFGTKRLDEVTQDDIKRFERFIAIGKKGKPLSVSSLNNIVTVLNVVFEAAVEQGYIDETRRPKVKMYRRPRLKRADRGMYYDDETYERMVACARSIDQMILVVFLLGGDAGLREGEMAALQWGDIDQKAGVLSIRRNMWKNPRTGEVTTDLPKSWEPREVEMTTRLAEALRSLPPRLRQPLILQDRYGEQVSRNTLSSWIKRVERRLKMKETGRIHILRHTVATRLAAAGASPLDIMQVLGHQDVSMTMIYAHLNPASRAKAIRLLDKHKSEAETTSDNRDGARIDGSR